MVLEILEMVYASHCCIVGKVGLDSDLLNVCLVVL